MGNYLGTRRRGLENPIPEVPLATRYQETVNSLPIPPNFSTIPSQQHCMVCDEADVTFPSEPPTIRCVHPPDVCASCLETYVCSYIHDGFSSIKCPSLYCMMRFSEASEVLRTNISEERRESYEQFCEMKLRHMLRTERSIAWCKAPGCGSAQFHAGGDQCTMVICCECSEKSCFRHDVPWHEGIACEEFDKKLKHQSPEQVKQSKKSKRWLGRNAKICPGESCGRWIQKTDGCDHMRCSPPAGCGSSFCWRCLAFYSPGGQVKHKPTCRHYRFWRQG